MNNQNSSLFFLFSSFNQERMDWIFSLIQEHQKNILNLKNNIVIEHIYIYLTGTALFALYREKLIQYILSFHHTHSFLTISIIIDGKEASINGIDADSFINNSFPANVQISVTDAKASENFWKNLQQSIKNTSLIEDFCFLQLEGPYMNRTSIYAMEYVKSSLKLGLKTQLFNYLDGIHLGHEYQTPSEFENIGSSLKVLLSKYSDEELFRILTCSRCATARGYYDSKNDLVQPGVMEDFGIVNLNKVVDQFELNNICLSANSGVLLHSLHTQEKPIIENILIITQHPYNSEYCFGGISFAMASANHEIPTKVIFVEDGVYSVVGKHDVKSSDKIFNIQDAIEATGDMDNLEYYVHKDSLSRRNVGMDNAISQCKEVSINQLEKIIFRSSKNAENNLHKRIILF